MKPNRSNFDRRLGIVRDRIHEMTCELRKIRGSHASNAVRHIHVALLALDIASDSAYRVDMRHARKAKP